MSRGLSYPRAVRRRLTQLCRSPERGSASLELILLTPIFILFLLLVVAVGRVVDARIQIDAAVHAAARSASLALTPASAELAAQDAAAQSLAGAGIACSPMTVSADVGALVPGGTARVTVHCTVALGDVSGLGLFPGHETISASFSSVIDTYRSSPGQP